MLISNFMNIQLKYNYCLTKNTDTNINKLKKKKLKLEKIYFLFNKSMIFLFSVIKSFLLIYYKKF